MGMYDELRVKYPLPDPQVQDHVFQTKDLDNFLEEYEITAEGRLHRLVWKWAAKERRKTGNWSDNLPLLTRIPDSLTKEDVEYHGYMIFYTSIQEEGNWKPYEYQAKFSEGQLVSLEKVMSIPGVSSQQSL